VIQFQGDAAYPPADLAEHIAWLQQQLAAIPAEHRDTAELAYEAPESCEQTNGWLYIRYRRPETPEELAERLAAKQARERVQRAARVARKRWEDRLAAQMHDVALFRRHPFLIAHTGQVVMPQISTPQE
jgi:hypothetical protein